MADYANQKFLSEKISLPHSNFKIGVVSAMWNGEITS
jgi:6,7-dimethyl-8-ribityllumazine synthase